MKIELGGVGSTNQEADEGGSTWEPAYAQVQPPQSHTDGSRNSTSGNRQTSGFVPMFPCIPAEVISLSP
jgi:hypothetical protein